MNELKNWNRCDSFLLIAALCATAFIILTRLILG